jgi:hypothetical protein
MIDKNLRPYAGCFWRSPSASRNCLPRGDPVSRGQESAVLGRPGTATSLVLSPLLCLGQEQACQFFDMIISDLDSNCSQGGVAAIRSRCISHSPFSSCLCKIPVHSLPQGAWLGSSGYFRTFGNFLSPTKLSLPGLSQV